MPVTLKELAARANVHPSTISRVANNDPGLRIASATRSRIEALLRETGYRPNGIARGLKMRQTNVLAVVIPDVTNPFFAALFRGVEDAAAPRGFNVLLCNTDGLPERQRPNGRELFASLVRQPPKRRVVEIARQGQRLVAAEEFDVGVLAIEIAHIGRVYLNLFAREIRPSGQPRPDRDQIRKTDLAISQQLAQ